MSKKIDQLCKKINQSFASDKTLKLLKPEWREKNLKSGISATGFCYIASEVLFHALGGRAAGLKIRSQRMKDGGCHWFLLQGETVIDPTSSQLSKDWDYSLSRSANFLTSRPSKRAIELATICKIKIV